jgi:transitional endoplasmic reticulum ATPase
MSNRDRRDRNYDDEEGNGNNNGSKKRVVHVAEVVRHGTSIVLPTGVSYGDAIDILAQKKEEEEQEISFTEKILAFPWDAALALKKALDQKFGIAMQQEDFFSGARMISIESGPNGEAIPVPWGTFTAPGIDGSISCSAAIHEGRLIFELVANVKRKHQSTIQEVAALTRDILTRDSIYRGKAFEMKFRDENGNVDKMAQPKFMDVSKTEKLIFSRFIEEEIKTNILTPIRHASVLRANDMPVSRKVLAAGEFGTGKTLLARNVAQVATDQGWTFVYAKAEEFTDALEFAKGYSPAVVFVEDIDRTTSGQRDKQLDNLSYALDGINNKGVEIITIMTTNKPGEINKVILRAGRTDIAIFLDTPDPEAVTRLVRSYGKDSIAADEDLVAVGEVLAGQIPAVIREVVERSKLRSIARTDGQQVTISADDLVFTAKSYLSAQERLAGPETEKADYLKTFGQGIGEAIATGVAGHLAQVHLANSQNGHHAPATVSA